MNKKTLSLSLSAIHVKYVYCLCQIIFEIYSNSQSSNYPYNMEKSETLTEILQKFQHMYSILRIFSDTWSLQIQDRTQDQTYLLYQDQNQGSSRVLQ